MLIAPKTPFGPLRTVERPWEYKNGWVRAPMHEIVCNKSLTKQAKLLWLWLASLKEGTSGYTWADCEEALGCQTKARKNCLGQLVSQGFLEVSDSGVVILKDPYKAYRDSFFDSDNSVTTYRGEEANLEVSEIEKPEEKPKEKRKRPTPSAQSKEQLNFICAESWNTHKPGSYASLRTLSADRLQAVKLHIENLAHDPKDVCGFIEIVCKGIYRDDWWLNQCNKKCFDAVFGSGKVQDKKRSNVQQLYDLGLKDDYRSFDGKKPPQEIENSEIANIKYRLSVAKQRRNPSEIERWTKALEEIEQTTEVDEESDYDF